MNCKPGDMAIIVGNSAAVGIMVTCIRLESPNFGVTYLPVKEPCWKISRPIPWFANHDNLNGSVLIGNVPYCEDKFLLPIRPDALEDDEEEDLDINQPVMINR